MDARAVFDVTLHPIHCCKSRKWDNNFCLPHRPTKVTLMYERLRLTQACLCLFMTRPRIRKIW